MTIILTKNFLCQSKYSEVVKDYSKTTNLRLFVGPKCHRNEFRHLGNELWHSAFPAVHAEQKHFRWEVSEFCCFKNEFWVFWLLHAFTALHVINGAYLLTTLCQGLSQDHQRHGIGRKKQNFLAVFFIL